MVCQFCLSSQESHFSFIKLCYCFLQLFFIYFSSDLYDFFPSTNFGVFFFFFFSVVLDVKVGCLFIQCLSYLLSWDYIATNFPLGTAFGASHRFQVIMFLLLFVSRNFLISIFISSVTCLLFRNILFNLNMFVIFIFFPVIDI